MNEAFLKNTELEEFDINFIREMPNDNIDKILIWMLNDINNTYAQ